MFRNQGLNITAIGFCVVLLFWSETCAIVKVDFVTTSADPLPFLASLFWSGPALDIAQEILQAKYNGTFNLTLTYLGEKTKPAKDANHGEDGRLLAHWYYKERDENSFPVLVLPGGLDTSRDAQLATLFNILFISSVTSKDDLFSSRTNSTWISSSYTCTSQFASVLSAVLERYNWTTVFGVVDDVFPVWYTVLSDLVLKSMTTLRGTQSVFRHFSSTTKMPSFRALLKEFTSVSRVLLFFGHGSVLRQLMITAALLNMTNGEYVYLAAEPFVNPRWGNLSWQYGDENDQIAKTAFQSLFAIQPFDSSVPTTKGYRDMGLEIQRRAKIDYNYSYPITFQPFHTIVAVYAAMQTVLQMINETLAVNSQFNFADGRKFAKLLLNRTFHTDVGKVYYDEGGDRRLDMVVSRYNKMSPDVLTPVLFQSAGSIGFEEVGNIEWVSDKWPPPNEPVCGYRHQKAACNPTENTIWIYATAVACVVCLSLGTGVTLVCIRRKHQEAELQDLWWLIDSSEIHDASVQPALIPNQKQSGLNQQLQPAGGARRFSLTFTRYTYKIQEVYLNPFQAPLFERFSTASISRRLQVLIKKLRQTSHDNINEFYGIMNVQETKMFFVCGFAAKGSAHDLYRTNMQVDFTFTVSFISDLLEGLDYLHDNAIEFHGHLTSGNCLINKFFTLKLGQLAFDRIERCLQNSSTKALPKNTVWTAPELLSGQNSPDRKSDIYAAGVIIVEIITRQEVQVQLAEEKPSLTDDNIWSGMATDPLDDSKLRVPVPIRPNLLECWENDRNIRPTAKRLKIEVTTILAAGHRRRTNVKLIDKMLARLETYAATLEDDVAQRTTELIHERQKCDGLLLQILPKTIVDQLKNGQKIIPEAFDMITLLFSDLVGFLQFVQESSLLMVTTTLGDIEDVVDTISSRFDVYKVEAISDSFVVASGLPERTVKHTENICSFAIATRTAFALSSDKVPSSLQLKVGIHSGPVVAGIMGSKRPRYCLFGDTVNTASRMCSHGEANKIHLSPNAAERVFKHSKFVVIPRGVIAIKGKSDMLTYWLNGQTDHE